MAPEITSKIYIEENIYMFIKGDLCINNLLQERIA